MNERIRHFPICRHEPTMHFCISKARGKIWKRIPLTSNYSVCFYLITHNTIVISKCYLYTMRFIPLPTLIPCPRLILCARLIPVPRQIPFPRKIPLPFILKSSPPLRFLISSFRFFYILLVNSRRTFQRAWDWSGGWCRGLCRNNTRTRIG